MRREKCLAQVQIRLGESLLAELQKLAKKGGFESVSPLIRQILTHHVYGRVSWRDSEKTL